MTQLEQLKAKAREESSAIAFYQYTYIPMGVQSENYWKAIDTLIETVYQAAHSEGVRVADADGAYHSGFLAGNQARTEDLSGKTDEALQAIE